MTRARRIAGRMRHEGGVVLVMFALMLPVLIGFGGLVIDVGNWFAHKRHLQTQADAGALAGAGKFRFPCDEARNAEIRAEVAKYSSVDDPTGYNPQIGDTPLDELHEKINSETWGPDDEQPTPVDETVRGPENDPCRAKMIDVKLTETDLPWWLRLFGDLVPYINTQARVEIMQQKVGVGALPVGVPEVQPKKARAIFVDEITGTEIASTPLVRTGSEGGLAIWSNVDLPVPVKIDRARIGVRIVLSGSDSTACGDPLVNCYGAGSNTAVVAGQPGLAHIRGWSSEPAGTASAPQVRGADLFAGTCEDGYFTATAAYPCSVNVGASVDFGGASIDTVRVLAKKTGAKDNTAVELKPPAAAGEQWAGPSGVSIAAGSRATSIDLLWQTGCDTNRTKSCKTEMKSLGTVQRAFAGDEALDVSGPIKLLRVSEGPLPGANSFERCASCTHDLVVTVGLQPGLENAQSVGDPIVSLKVSTASQNQALDCDPALPKLQDELANGCGPSYTPNDGQACPVKNDLWGSPQPWNCVVINTGKAVGQVTHGLNLRILGAAVNPPCTAPNDWASFPNFSPGDPRIVQVFLAPFGAFTGAGGTTVPVTGFATFYVTGWDGGGCQGSGDDPAGQGEIVGHFIKYVKTLNDGSAGDEVCDENTFGSCVAVMTR